MHHLIWNPHDMVHTHACTHIHTALYLNLIDRLLSVLETISPHDLPVEDSLHTGFDQTRQSIDALQTNSTITLCTK